MSEQKNHSPGHADSRLAVVFLSLVVPLLLLIGRSVDNNRLTSWRWVFDGLETGRFFLLLLLVVAGAFLLARYGGRLHKCWFPPLLAFVSTIFFWQEPEVIVDAGRYFSQAKQLEVHGLSWFLAEWGKEVFAWTDMPLMPMAYGLLFKVFGEYRLVIQICNSLLFSLTVYLACLLGSDLWDKETGCLGGMLLLGFPYLYTQVPLMLVDVGTMFLLLLTMATSYRALREGGVRRLLLAAAVIFCTIFVKYSTWLLLTVLVVIFAVNPAGDWRTTFRRALGLALVSLVWVVMVLFHYREVIAKQVELLTMYQKPGLERWGESLVSTFLFQTHPLLTAGAVYSVFRAWRRRDVRYPVVAYLVIVLLFVLGIRRIRYTMPLFPLLALLAAYGFRDLGDGVSRRLLAWSIAGTALLTATAAYLPFLCTMSERNIQEAGRFLDTLAGDRVAVYTLLGNGRPVLDPRIIVPVLDLYCTKQLDHHPVDPGASRPAWVETSPLRFTWEYPLPDFYLPDERSFPETVVVVKSSEYSPLPPRLSEKLSGYHIRRSFEKTTTVFLYQSFVVLYQKDE